MRGRRTLSEHSKVNGPYTFVSGSLVENAGDMP